MSRGGCACTVTVDLSPVAHPQNASDVRLRPETDYDPIATNEQPPTVLRTSKSLEIRGRRPQKTTMLVRGSQAVYRYVASVMIQVIERWCKPLMRRTQECPVDRIE